MKDLPKRENQHGGHDSRFDKIYEEAADAVFIHFAVQLVREESG